MYCALSISIVKVKVDGDIVNKEVEKMQVDDNVVNTLVVDSKLEEKSIKIDNINQFIEEVTELRSDFAIMKQEFDKLKVELEKRTSKQFTKLNAEIKELKEDYKRCLDDLRKETLARNEAEEVAKTLMETLNAKLTLNENKAVESMDVDNENIKTDSDVGKSQDQQKESLKNKNCHFIFKSKFTLSKHLTNHDQKVMGRNESVDEMMRVVKMLKFQI